jgi:Atypical PilZ domain, cyclic di-GMP receptor
MSAGFQVDLILPLRWQVTTTAACRSRQLTNACVYAILDGYTEAVTATEVASAATPVERLEAKVNLLLALMTRLLQAQDQDSPPGAHAVQLSTQQISWQSEVQGIPGQQLSVQLFLDPRLPQPLTLCGVVCTSAPGLTCLELDHPAEQEAAAWQRWLFRQHRQQIAKLRGQGQR